MLITIVNKTSTTHKHQETKTYSVTSVKKTILILILWSKNKINSVNKDPAIKKNKNIKVKKMKISIQANKMKDHLNYNNSISLILYYLLHQINHLYNHPN